MRDADSIMACSTPFLRWPGRRSGSAGTPLSVLTVAAWTAVAASGYALYGPQPVGLLATGAYSLCSHGSGANCVIDGDTVIMSGVTIRVEDIDAPETIQAKCASEAALGKRATNRLVELMNAAPVAAVDDGGRDEDRYGRKLRVLMQNGESLGGRLVREGLARPWTGRRMPWC
jgi:endonuclease YncB( thermonuclease family)